MSKQKQAAPQRALGEGQLQNSSSPLGGKPHFGWLNPMTNFILFSESLFLASWNQITFSVPCQFYSLVCSIAALVCLPLTSEKISFSTSHHFII